MKKIIKVNFGCFSSGLPGWISVDNARRHIVASKILGLPRFLYFLGLLKKSSYNLHAKGKFNNIVYGDATKKMKFESNSVDYLYSSHMLEHLYPRDAIYFLSECKRVLKKGGVLRLLLPDLEYEAKIYMKSLGNQNAANIFSWKVYANDDKSGYKNGHKWMYDKYYLKNILKKVGFEKVVCGKFKTGSFPDVDKLDSYKNSLIIEAIK